MNEERPSSERNGERDSQLSAMFDGELSAAECELIARRLSRDEALRAQWSRYALIGGALRAERGVKLDDRVARRVQAQVTQETTYGDSTASPAAAVPASTPRVPVSDRWMKFARPMFGAGIAASVAAASILWLRNGAVGDSQMLASNAEPAVAEQPSVGQPAQILVAANPAPVASEPVISNGEPDRYTTPPSSSQTNVAPPARLANYVVAHSEYSGPLSRRLALLGLVSNEGAPDDGAPAQQPIPATVNPETNRNAP